MFNLRSPNRERERGQSLVEMALTLPILIFVFLALFDFGRLLFLYSEVSNAAREGARWGSVSGILDDGEVQQWRDCDGIRVAVRERFAIPITIEDDDINIVYDNGVSPYSFTCNGSTGSGPDGSQIEPGDRVVVTVNTQFKFVTPVMIAFMSGVDVSFTAARTIINGGTQVPPCCY
jgi:hypothetical protein